MEVLVSGPCPRTLHCLLMTLQCSRPKCVHPGVHGKTADAARVLPWVALHARARLTVVVQYGAVRGLPAAWRAGPRQTAGAAAAAWGEGRS